MVLSDKRILEEMERGNVVITPFDEQNLSTSSYDVTLGEHFFVEQRNIKNIYNLYNKEDTNRVWGTESKRAAPAKQIFKDIRFDFVGVGEDDLIILLRPGETILAHTNEFIGGKNHITTMMKARSSLGRNFIEVCKCAGWGDVGYTNRWTMEITNNSEHYNIPLVVGRRIAQIIFFETEGIRENNYTTGGKYQQTTDLQQLQREWGPSALLPKMYNEREIRNQNNN